MLFRKKQPNFAKQIGIVPPKPLADRKGLAIVAIVKNEAEYIGEWAEFHLLAGVGHFFIYDDGSSDGTVKAIANVVPAEKLTVTSWINGNPRDIRRNRYLDNQVMAYVHAVSNYGSRFRWMTFIDADEFIVPVSADSIMQALQPLSEYSNVSLPWHMFGRGGIVDKPDGNTVQNFTKRFFEPLSDLAGVRNFKCIVDPCMLSQVAIHSFETLDNGETTVNDRGIPFTNSNRSSAAFYSAINLQLNHYYSKSEAELAAKLDRGSASPISDMQYVTQVRQTVENIESKIVEDRTAIDFLSRVGS